MKLIEPIRILIADDHQLFRSGITSLLDDVSDILIVGEAENGEQTIEKYFELKPDIILLDISMPKLDGLEVIKRIKVKDRNVKVIFLTMHDSEEYIFFADKLGAKGLLSKNTLKGELIFAIKTVYQNEIYFGKQYDKEKLKELRKKFKGSSSTILDDTIALTEREKEILIYIADGLLSKEIGDKLGITKRTVDYHRSRIMQRLGIKTLPEFISYAVKFSMANKHEEIE
ncbi:MAG: response regulator transcription factor [Melioribacteraceae bacterium]|nr:response regulator transcription factor [Melioribacteraceae bacterium]